MQSLSIGDLCQIVPYNPDHINIGVRIVGQEDNFTWIPRGSHVLITQLFQDSAGEFRFCNVLYNGIQVEVCCDDLGVEL